MAFQALGKVFLNTEVIFNDICPRYEMSNCLLEATLQKIESDCKCTPKFFMTTVTGYEPCEGKQVSLL
jgi:hypothetical protein